jgi:hypothetical protein
MARNDEDVLRGGTTGARDNNQRTYIFELAPTLISWSAEITTVDHHCATFNMRLMAIRWRINHFSSENIRVRFSLADNR